MPLAGLLAGPEAGCCVSCGSLLSSLFSFSCFLSFFVFPIFFFRSSTSNFQTPPHARKQDSRIALFFCSSSTCHTASSCCYCCAVPLVTRYYLSSCCCSCIMLVSYGGIMILVSYEFTIGIRRKKIIRRLVLCATPVLKYTPDYFVHRTASFFYKNAQFCFYFVRSCEKVSQYCRAGVETAVRSGSSSYECPCLRGLRPFFRCYRSLILLCIFVWYQ